MGHQCRAGIHSGFLTLALGLTLVLVLSEPSQAQLSKQTLFDPAVKAVQMAVAENAELLAPELLQNARRKLAEAEKAYEEGKKLTDIQKRINETVALARRAQEVAQMGQVAFKALLPAREACAKANAPTLAADLYNDAEKVFRDAVKALQLGDVNEARARGERAESKYREAELVAIKAVLLQDARRAREEAVLKKAQQFAPISFGKGESYLQEAEILLNKDRYAAQRARLLAQQAAYEFRHAAYLAEPIRQAVGEPELVERQILNYETVVARIANEFGLAPAFDQDVDAAAQQIVQAIRDLKQEDEQLQQSLTEREKTIADLRKQMREFQQQHATLEEQLQEKQRQLEARRIRDAKIKKIRETFAPDEAEVLMSGDDLVIRLYGLTFPVGKATISPEYFNLLAKVQQAIREFPDAHVTVEGHTDSQGDDASNQRLSFQRANAVRQYLLANMGLSEDDVSAIGYGEARPIATNETAEGRAQNRRIEIVLTMPE